MNTNFSDGLSFLITKRVSIATEHELLGTVDNPDCLAIHAAFAQFYNKAEELKISYVRYQDALKQETLALKMAIKPFIVRLQEQNLKITYNDYRIYRDILSIINYCPYLFDRALVYEVIHLCDIKQIF